MLHAVHRFTETQQQQSTDESIQSTGPSSVLPYCPTRPYSSQKGQGRLLWAKALTAAATLLMMRR